MAPDIEDLIKRVNSLTLDKNRLRQKLTQLSQAGGAGSIASASAAAATSQLSGYSSQYSNNQRSSSNISNQQHSQEDLNISESGGKVVNNNRSISTDSSSSTTAKSPSSHSLSAQQQQTSSPSSSSSSTTTTPATTNTTAVTRSNCADLPNRTIAGIECTTSCEEDLIFMNELYRKRLDEYNEKWDYIQSKCSALLSELNALQEHFALQKREKLDLEDKLKEKCDENESIRSELQTVVLNYESQLSAMSEHLSMITSKVVLDDDDSLARVQ